MCCRKSFCARLSGHAGRWAGKLAATSEKSLVTVLIVDTVSSTDHVAACDPDEAQAFLDQIFTLIQNAIVRHRGHLVSFAGDGGVAVFGWPDSLEDHADWACEAAMSIIDARQQAITGPDGRTARFRVGVHSGLVGLRQITLGGARRLDTVGGTVHLAAALEKKAPPGGVMISGSTLQLCTKALPVREWGAIPVFEKMGQKTYLLLPQSQSVTEVAPPLRLVGRQKEIAALERTIPSRNSAFSCVALIGEPGIGKSRLLTEIGDRAKARGVRVLSFNASAATELDPFAVFRHFLQTLLAQANEGADDGAAGAGSSHRPGEDRLLVGAVLDGRIGRDDISYRPSQLQIVRSTIRTTLELNRSTPLLMVVDDVQLIDPESLACLAELALNIAPRNTALLISARTDAAHVVSGLAPEIVPLEPMPDEAMAQLAMEHPAGRLLAGQERDKAVRKADGVPFVLEQIMLSADRDNPQGFDLLPLRVHSLIHARLNKLNAQARELAQGLSVLGDDTGIDFLAAFTGLSRHALETQLSELQLLGFVRIQGGATVRFCHAILADACLTTIPQPRRRDLHLRAIEAALSRNEGHRHDFLAHHYEGAEQYLEAIECLWKAGLQARRTSAMGSLQRIVTRAFICIEKAGAEGSERYVDFVLMASPTLLQIGEFAFVKPHLHRALELAQQRGGDDTMCSALSQLATLRWFEGDYSGGLDNAREAVERSDRLASLPHVFAARMVHSILLWITGDIKAATDLQSGLCELLSGNLENSRLGAAAIPSVMARTFMAWAFTEIGRYDESLSVATKALEIARNGGDPFAEALALSALGNTFITKGSFDDACATLEECHVLCSQNGYYTSLPTVVGNLSLSRSRVGRAAEGCAIARKWFESNERQRTGHFELLYAYKGYAEALAWNGQQTESLAAIEAGWQVASQLDSPCLKLRILEARIRIRNELGADLEGVSADRAEVARICNRHGLVTQSWQ